MLPSLAFGWSCASRAANEARQTLRFLTWTSPGRLMTTLAEHWTAAIPGVQVVAEPIPGSFFVVSALHDGQAELGLAQADVVYTAFRRGFEPRRYPHTNLRGISVLWVNVVFVAVRRESPIQSIQDLRGRRVGTVLQGSSGELLARLMLGAHGLSYSDLQPQFHAIELLADELRAGRIDAALATGAILNSALNRLNRQGVVRLVPINRELARTLPAQYPFIKLMRIPADELPGHGEDYDTVGADGLLVCRQDLTEPLVHSLTKEFFDVLPRLASDPVAASILPERAPATPIPLHPGAARYYREREILR